MGIFLLLLRICLALSFISSVTLKSSSNVFDGPTPVITFYLIPLFIISKYPVIISAGSLSAAGFCMAMYVKAFCDNCKKLKNLNSEKKAALCNSWDYPAKKKFIVNDMILSQLGCFFSTAMASWFATQIIKSYKNTFNY